MFACMCSHVSSTITKPRDIRDQWAFPIKSLNPADDATAYYKQQTACNYWNDHKKILSAKSIKFWHICILLLTYKVIFLDSPPTNKINHQFTVYYNLQILFIKRRLLESLKLVVRLPSIDHVERYILFFLKAFATNSQ